MPRTSPMVTDTSRLEAAVRRLTMSERQKDKKRNQLFKERRRSKTRQRTAIKRPLEPLPA